MAVELGRARSILPRNGAQKRENEIGPHFISVQLRSNKPRVVQTIQRMATQRMFANSLTINGGFAFVAVVPVIIFIRWNLYDSSQGVFVIQ